MRRVLLAIDDFNELRFCETVLKKVGFSIQSFQTDLAISESILTFNPDLLVMSAVGHRVNGLNYLAKLKVKNKSLPVILLGARNRLNITDKQIVALLEPPLTPQILIEVLANLFELDENALVAKYQKASEFKVVKDESSIRVSGKDIGVNGKLIAEKMKPSPEAMAERSSRYKKIATLSTLPPFLGMNAALVQEQVKEFRQTENSDEVRRIDEERRMFAIELARRSQKTTSS